MRFQNLAFGTRGKSGPRVRPRAARVMTLVRARASKNATRRHMGSMENSPWTARARVPKANLATSMHANSVSMCVW